MENIFRQAFSLSGPYWGWMKLSIWNSRHFPRESEGEIQGRKKKGIFSGKGIVWLYNYLFLNEISIESVFPFFFWLPLLWDTYFGKTETHFIIILEEVAETEDIVVYAKFSSGWEYTTIWAWENESGKNAFSDFTEPRITSVDMNMYEIGEEAGSILIKNLAHPNLRIQTFTSEPCIFERETT